MNQNGKDIPPMPDSSDDLLENSEGLKSASPGNEKGEIQVDAEVAGDVFALPFEFWHIANPKIPPLSEEYKRAVSAPLSRILNKYGLAKFTRDEFLVAFYLWNAVYARLKIIKESKPKKEIKPDVGDNSRKEGQGKDDSGKTFIVGAGGPVPESQDLHS